MCIYNHIYIYIYILLILYILTKYYDKILEDGHIGRTLQECNPPRIKMPTELYFKISKKNYY